MKITIADLMETKPEELAAKQHVLFKQHVIDVLSKVIQLIKDDKYDDVHKMTDLSPAGDGHGSENVYINFTYKPDGDMDIGDVLFLLENLEQMAMLSSQDIGEYEKKEDKEWTISR